jgi:Zn-dependent protease
MLRPSDGGALDNPEIVTLLPLWYAVFLLSLTCHEAAHAFAAYRGGDNTAYLGGQVTLNPIPHMRREPFGTVLVPLLTFVSSGWMMGWASAPYDPLWESRYPRRAALMAACGPIANLVLAALAFVLLKVGLSTGTWTMPAEFPPDRLVAPAADAAAALDGVGRLLSVMLSLNLVLLVFNLLPLPPMDGAALVAGLVPPLRGMYDQLRSSQFTALACLLAAMLLFPYLFRPIQHWVLVSLYS